MKLYPLLGLSMLCMSQAQAFQFPDQKITAYQCENACPELSHDPLHFEWSIQDKSLVHQPSLEQKSYSYQETVTMADLQTGINIETLGPKAVIHISGLNGQAIPELEITTPSKQRLNLIQSSSLLSQEETFSDPAFNQLPQMFSQLKEELGAGTFKISTKDKTLDGKAPFMISIFDKYSEVYLSVQTSKPSYQLDEQVIATITLNDIIDYPIESVEAFIKSPKGTKYPLSLTKLKNSVYEGRSIMTSDMNELGANWYIDADIKAWIGDQSVTRSGHTAFSYNIPSAKLVTLTRKTNDSSKLTATIEVAQPSRYALDIVLYYKDEAGQMHPLSNSQSANWLEAGTNSLDLALDKSSFAKYPESSLYVGYFHLKDYGQLKTVYHYDTPIKLSELG